MKLVQLLPLLLATVVQAATLDVTTTADSGIGSLRTQIAAALSGDIVAITATGSPNQHTIKLAGLVTDTADHWRKTYFGPAATDIQLAIEVSGDLGSPTAWSTAETTVEANTLTTLQARDNVPVAGAPMRFIRLNTTRPWNRRPIDTRAGSVAAEEFFE